MAISASVILAANPKAVTVIIGVTCTIWGCMKSWNSKSHLESPPLSAWGSLWFPLNCPWRLAPSHWAQPQATRSHHVDISSNSNPDPPVCHFPERQRQTVTGLSNKAKFKGPLDSTLTVADKQTRRKIWSENGHHLRLSNLHKQWKLDCTSYFFIAIEMKIRRKRSAGYVQKT